MNKHLDQFSRIGGARQLVDREATSIVVEDVDSCQFLTVETETKKKKSLNGDFNDCDDSVPYEYIRMNNYMSDFLNLMDGSTCLENVLWVFTTNYIEKIEPSLIRSGRIDKKFLIDYATPETFKEFLKYHFNKDIDDIKLKDKTSFAEVQTDVMSGMTAEQIIDKYRKWFYDREFGESWLSR